MIAATVLLIGWDIYAYVKGGGEATISSVILDTSKEFPPLPFAFGVYAAIFFGRKRINKWHHRKLKFVT